MPLGFEPVVPVGASGLAPRQPEVVGVDRDLLGGGTPVLSPRAEGRRNATRLDPLRLGFAGRRGRRCFALADRGRCLGGPLPTGLALGLDPQRLGLASWRGWRRFALAGRESAWVARFLPVWLLDMFDPSLPGRPERTLDFGSDLHACPASHSPGRGAGSPGHRWPVPIPALAGPGGSDPRIRTAAAAAEPSGGVLWGLPLSDRP